MNKAILIFGFLLLCSSQLFAQPDSNQEEKKEPDAQDLFEKVTKLVEQEIFLIKQNEIDMHIRAIKLQFDVTEKQLEELNSARDEIARSIQEGFQHENLKQTITQRIGGPGNLKNIKLNGELINLVPSDKESLPVTLNVSSQRHGIWISSDRGGASMSSRSRFDIRTDKRWKKATSFLDDEQIREFYETADQNHRKSTLDVVVSLLTIELMLTEDQIPKVREWFEDDIKTKVSFRMSPFHSARQIIRSVQKEQPEFLSDVQYQAFIAIQTELMYR